MGEWASIKNVQIIKSLYSQTMRLRSRIRRALPPRSLMLFWLGPAVLLALLVRALRPLLLIMSGALPSQRIGHYCLDTELYLCQKDAGAFSPRTFDIFYHDGVISNQQLKKMWDRTLRVWSFASPLDRVSRRLPGAQAHVVPIQVWSGFNQDMHSLVGLTSPHLSFTLEEEQRGCQAVCDLGIPESTPFVCFHARDSSYLDTTIPENRWNYHSYRDAQIQNFVPAMKALVDRGNCTVRMGAVVSEPLSTNDPGIIDYAARYRTEFLDIFLCARCRFFLGSHTGLFTVAASFRRPLALVNVIPVEMATTWGPKDLFIPKKMWSRDQGRFLTFREVFDSGVAGFHHSDLYAKSGIEPVENTPEEITALALEMDNRLAGTWESTQADEELQASFWSVFKTKNYHGPVVSRIGAEFLQQNQELLA